MNPSSSPQPGQRRRLRVPAAFAVAVAATALFAVCTALTGSGPTAFAGAGRGASRQAALRVAARRAEATGVAATAPPSLSEAGVFITEVDPITGDVDVSGLPGSMGVYAIYDDVDRLQYIGLSKMISKSVEGHAEAIGPSEAGQLIASVRCLEMPGESKEVLKATWEKWITEHMDAGGEIPAGNLPEGAPGADRRWRSRAAQGRQPLNLAGVRGIASMPEAVEAVREAVVKHPVVLFMKGTPVMPQCGFSARSVGIMNSIGVPFDTVNVMDEAANPGVREAVKQFSNWPTIPQLFVNGELIGGADIIQEMYTTGQLVPTLKSAAEGPKESGADEAASTSEGAAVPKGNVQLIDDPSRPTASSLSRALNEAFRLHTLRIVDESSAHEGDAGALEMGLTSESHFRVEVVAPEFEGLTPVQRQQNVYAVLSDVMPRIHALSLVTRTPAEV